MKASHFSPHLNLTSISLQEELWNWNSISVSDAFNVLIPNGFEALHNTSKATVQSDRWNRSSHPDCRIRPSTYRSKAYPLSIRENWIFKYFSLCNSMLLAMVFWKTYFLKILSKYQIWGQMTYVIQFGMGQIK